MQELAGDLAINLEGEAIEEVLIIVSFKVKLIVRNVSRTITTKLHLDVKIQRS